MEFQCQFSAVLEDINELQLEDGEDNLFFLELDGWKNDYKKAERGVLPGTGGEEPGFLRYFLRRSENNGNLLPSHLLSSEAEARKL